VLLLAALAVGLAQRLPRERMRSLSSGHRSQLSRDIVHTFDQGVSDGMVQLVVAAVLVEGRAKSELLGPTGCRVASLVITLVQRYLADGEAGLPQRRGPEVLVSDRDDQARNAPSTARMNGNAQRFRAG
jgi:hypothetical protein